MVVRGTECLKAREAAQARISCTLGVMGMAEERYACLITSRSHRESV